jgi:microfibrillar-associated protein 1
MSAKDPFSILYKNPSLSSEKSHKIEIYRPGKAPNWPEEQDSIETPQNTGPKPIEIAPITTSIPQHNIIPSELSEKNTPQISKKNTEVNLYPEEVYEKALKPTVLAKPQFTFRDKRITHKERENREQEEQQILQELKEIQEDKKNRTKVIVAEAILKEELDNIEPEQENETSDEEDPQEFVLWKIREIKRIMRDKEEREQRKKEILEIERRRNLTDWERNEEDKRLGNDETAKPAKQKIQYMQKYYSKGVYYQERDEHGKLQEIFMRDYNAPVEGDFDKSSLPKILQKRRGEFGKKGQSKYTHLNEEDTTNFDPLFMPQQELFLKQQMKGAGFKSMNQFDIKKSG